MATGLSYLALVALSLSAAWGLSAKKYGSANSILQDVRQEVIEAFKTRGQGKFG